MDLDPTTPPGDTWEYRAVAVGGFNSVTEFQTALDRMGGQGWELVTVTDKASNWLGGTDKVIAVFKRYHPADSAAGWRPDPTGTGRFRYWNGERWTRDIVGHGPGEESEDDWPE